jgi:hypothetical protein
LAELHIFDNGKLGPPALRPWSRAWTFHLRVRLFENRDNLSESFVSDLTGNGLKFLESPE